jgi:hypothetical protein
MSDSTPKKKRQVPADLRGIPTNDMPLEERDPRTVSTRERRLINQADEEAPAKE